MNGRHVTSRASEKGCGAKERYRRRCEKFSKRRIKSVVVVVDGDAVYSDMQLEVSIFTSVMVAVNPLSLARKV